MVHSGRSGAAKQLARPGRLAQGSGMSAQSGRRFARILSALLCWLGLAAASVPGVEEIRQWREREQRVQQGARRILAANTHLCRAWRKDFGLTSVSPNLSASEPVRRAWAQALGLGDGSTVIAVFADGPAAKAGLRPGDAIVAVGDARWSENPAQGQAFQAAMAQAFRQSSLRLTIRRDGQESSVSLTGQDICDANVVMVPKAKDLASATGTTMLIAAPLTDLLPDDDELAFVLAHEAAHIFLGHVSPTNAAYLNRPDFRGAMEKEADQLGLRLMLRAGFRPEAAARAIPKVANAQRGPISRLLDLHGPYMATQERVDFLAGQAALLRAEAAP